MASGTASLSSTKPDESSDILTSSAAPVALEAAVDAEPEDAVEAELSALDEALTALCDSLTELAEPVALAEFAKLAEPAEVFQQEPSNTASNMQTTPSVSAPAIYPISCGKAISFLMISAPLIATFLRMWL